MKLEISNSFGVDDDDKNSSKDRVKNKRQADISSFSHKTKCQNDQIFFYFLTLSPLYIVAPDN